MRKTRKIDCGEECGRVRRRVMFTGDNVETFTGVHRRGPAFSRTRYQTTVCALSAGREDDRMAHGPCFPLSTERNRALAREATVRWDQHAHAWRSDVGPRGKNGRRTPVYFRRDTAGDEIAESKAGKRVASKLLDAYLDRRDEEEAAG